MCLYANGLQTTTVFTGGEDGLVRAWKPSGDEPQPKEDDEEEGVSTRPKKQKKKDRFKPY